jgi:HEAT repeat protein
VSAQHFDISRSAASSHVAKSLSELGPEVAGLVKWEGAAVDAYVYSLLEDDPLVRCSAATGLGLMGRNAKASSWWLTLISFSDSNWLVRRQATIALERIVGTDE